MPQSVDKLILSFFRLGKASQEQIEKHVFSWVEEFTSEEERLQKLQDLAENIRVHQDPYFFPLILCVYKRGSDDTKAFILANNYWNASLKPYREKKKRDRSVKLLSLGEFWGGDEYYGLPPKHRHVLGEHTMRNYQAFCNKARNANLSRTDIWNKESTGLLDIACASNDSGMLSATAIQKATQDLQFRVQQRQAQQNKFQPTQSPLGPVVNNARESRSPSTRPPTRRSESAYPTKRTSFGPVAPIGQYLAPEESYIGGPGSQSAPLSPQPPKATTSKRPHLRNRHKAKLQPSATQTTTSSFETPSPQLGRRVESDLCDNPADEFASNPAPSKMPTLHLSPSREFYSDASLDDEQLEAGSAAETNIDDVHPTTMKETELKQAPQHQSPSGLCDLDVLSDEDDIEVMSDYDLIPGAFMPETSLKDRMMLTTRALPNSHNVDMLDRCKEVEIDSPNTNGQRPTAANTTRRPKRSLSVEPWTRTGREEGEGQRPPAQRQKLDRAEKDPEGSQIIDLVVSPASAVSQCNETRTTIRAAESVRGSSWLNDVAIETVLSLLESDRVQIRNLRKEHDRGRFPRMAPRAWLRPGVRTVVMTVNLDNHWSVAVWDLEINVIHHFDSLWDPSSPETRQREEHIFEVISNFMERQKLSLPVAPTFIAQISRKQTNMDDCGIFCCINAFEQIMAQYGLPHQHGLPQHTDTDLWREILWIVVTATLQEDELEEIGPFTQAADNNEDFHTLTARLKDMKEIHSFLKGLYDRLSSLLDCAEKNCLMMRKEDEELKNAPETPQTQTKGGIAMLAEAAEAADVLGRRDKRRKELGQLLERAEAEVGLYEARRAGLGKGFEMVGEKIVACEKKLPLKWMEEELKCSKAMGSTLFDLMQAMGLYRGMLCMLQHPQPLKEARVSHPLGTIDATIHGFGPQLDEQKAIVREKLQEAAALFDKLEQNRRIGAMP